MAEEDRDGATAAVRSPNHRDLISALPDVILQTILSSLPTKFAIRTSILSKQWRHVWCNTPSLNFEWCGNYLCADSINETLAHYKSPKMMSFHFCLTAIKNTPYIESWIEFAKSRNVENMTIDLGSRASADYTIPYSFFINSSVKQLTLRLAFHDRMVPRDSVSWTSLKELVLRNCNLFDGSTMPKILSGCPVLESLTLYMCRCYNFKVLDLSKSLRLTTLEIANNCWVSGQIHIVAPHVHNLTLTVPPYWPCNLVDVSSLTEARLDIGFNSQEAFDADFLQQFVQNIIDKLRNVDKLTFGENFIKIFSLIELRCLPLPLFKFKALTFETMISQYVIPGMVKLVQSSRELKKLTVNIKDEGRIIPDEFLDYYLKCHGSKTDKTWSSEARVFKNIIRENVESMHMASFIELVLRSTKSLENMVVMFGSYLEERSFEELLDMVPVLSHENNNVSIVLGSTTKSDQTLFFPMKVRSNV
ncbi:F-box domain [Arabidopsis thaliana x Arabidopsis arenosa]|uniref:F-box domain n=1 Tax=Arabidopsis thaliana x Arabidopsis arenosa TaxID=1240361 RepID=A0A8T1Z1M2_9BRAS|nr:F-box domain [Arabidopsis thaliana x Arabidopsis arenosa]